MTDTVLIRGGNWSESELNDGWGNMTPPEWAEILAKMVVGRFEELAEAAGITAYWFPKTSEVIGPINQTFEPELLDELREQATQEIFERLINNELDDELPALEG